MSQTIDSVQYVYTCESGTPEATVMLTVSASQSAEFDDAAAGALQQALQGAFPAAWGADIQVLKQETTVTTYQTSDDVPPTFS